MNPRKIHSLVQSKFIEIREHMYYHYRCGLYRTQMQNYIPVYICEKDRKSYNNEGHGYHQQIIILLLFDLFQHTNIVNKIPQKSYLSFILHHLYMVFTFSFQITFLYLRTTFLTGRVFFSYGDVIIAGKGQQICKFRVPT